MSLSNEHRLELYKWVGRSAGEGNPIADRVLALLHELDSMEESVREALSYPMHDPKFISTMVSLEVLGAMIRINDARLAECNSRLDPLKEGQEAERANIVAWLKTRPATDQPEQLARLIEGGWHNP